MTPRSVTIVGASLAGLRAAQALRREGFEGEATLIGEESHLPYDCPPLLEQVLSGQWLLGRLALTTSEALDEDPIDTRLSLRATALELESRRLSLSDGSAIDVDAPTRVFSVVSVEGSDRVRSVMRVEHWSKARTPPADCWPSPVRRSRSCRCRGFGRISSTARSRWPAVFGLRTRAGLSPEASPNVVSRSCFLERAGSRQMSEWAR